MMIGKPSSVEADDLIQAGTIGLLNAIRATDETKGAAFDAYAKCRIRGAMLDELRKCDHLARPHRDKIKYGESVNIALCSFEELVEDGFDLADNNNPLRTLIRSRLLERAVAYFETMPKKYKHLMTRHYIDGESMRTAAEEVGFSETWACTVHKRIIKQLEEYASESA